MKNILAMVFVAIFILSSNVFAGDEVNSFSNFHKAFQKKYSTGVDNVEFSPDGKYILAQGPSIPIYVWYAKDLSLHKEFKLIHNDVKELMKNLIEPFLPKDRPLGIVGANFTPDSKSVYVGFDNGTAMMIDLNSGQQTTYKFTARKSTTTISAISRSGKILALGKSCLNIENNKLVSNGISSQSGLVITQDDKYLVTGSYHGKLIDVTDIATGKWRRWDPTSFFIDQNVTSVDVSPDNDTVAAGLGNGDIRLYSIRLNKEIGNLSHGGNSSVAFFSPDGKMLLSVSDNKTVKLWDVASGGRKRTWKASDKVSLIKWLRGTPWIAIGTMEGQLIIESTNKEETVFKGKVMENSIMGIDYLPAEHLFILCDYSGNIAAFKTE